MGSPLPWLELAESVASMGCHSGAFLHAEEVILLLVEISHVEDLVGKSASLAWCATDF